ncbi:hypothetical protein QWY84_03030 [Aquisalimonas lutea]|nr:hypothetical protein [Aquisalimonas lutea]MDN3516576.1 hypothetical protein [Aquisalimonas lutea]
MNHVPMVAEQFDGTECSFDLFARLLRERIIFVDGMIDDATSA